MYVDNDVLVRMTGRKDQVRRRLGSEVNRWGRVVSLIDYAARILHGMCGVCSDTPLQIVLLYQRRSRAAHYTMACLMRKSVAHSEGGPWNNNCTFVQGIPTVTAR